MKKNLSKFSLLHAVIILFVVVVDQWTKLIILRHLPLPSYSDTAILWSWGGDFLRIIHVRNLGALFSMGSSWPMALRVFVLKIMPLLFLCYLSFLLIFPKAANQKLPKFLRWQPNRLQGVGWSLAAGGGLGNIIDRIFRPDGVVDFIDVKLYGLFGWERWPTFNIADSAVVLAMILIVISEVRKK